MDQGDAKYNKRFKCANINNGHKTTHIKNNLQTAQYKWHTSVTLFDSGINGEAFIVLSLYKIAIKNIYKIHL